MNLILISVITMGGLGALFAFILSIANVKFKIEEDPKIEKILEALPGANCGGCGYASCRNFAEEIVKGGASVNACVVGGESVTQEIAKIMGVELKLTEKRVAFVHCRAHNGEKIKKAEYEGIKECGAADMILGADLACYYGCLGYGDCEDACLFDAITMVDDLPEIDITKCTGCGNCVKACPRNLISLEVLNRDVRYKVACASLDKGKKAREVCLKSCIGCGICEKVCPFDACHMRNGLPYIDERNCQACGVCAQKCPRNVIIEMGMNEWMGERVK